MHAVTCQSMQLPLYVELQKLNKTKKIAWCKMQRAYCMLHMSTSVFQDAVGPQKITDSEATNLVHIYVFFICIINLYDIRNSK